MRRLSAWATCLAPLLGLVVLAGCVSRPPPPPASRDTPAGTVELFKLYARQGNSSGEWDILSPGLKARFGQQMGRTLDVGDYIQARKAAMNDPNARAAEQALQTVFVSAQQPAGPDAMYVWVTATRGPFSRSARIKMVRLQRWELRVAGSDEPYWGYVNDPTFGVEKEADGSYVVWHSAAPGGQRSEQKIPASQVQGYQVQSRWYVDDLGGLESQFLPH